MGFWWQNYWTLQFQLLGSTTALLIQDWAKLGSLIYSLAKVQLLILPVCRAQKKWVQGTRFTAAVNLTRSTLVCGVAHCGASQHHEKTFAVFMYSYFTSETDELNAASWSLAGDKSPNMLQQDDTKSSQMSLSPTRALTPFDFPSRDPW